MSGLELSVARAVYCHGHLDPSPRVGGRRVEFTRDALQSLCSEFLLGASGRNTAEHSMKNVVASKIADLEVNDAGKYDISHVQKMLAALKIANFHNSILLRIDCLVTKRLYQKQMLGGREPPGPAAAAAPPGRVRRARAARSRSARGFFYT
eukprot:12414971-Karenia_brevis.AAC.1